MNHKKKETMFQAASGSMPHPSDGARVIQMPQKQYDQMVKKASPASTYVKNCIMAFLFGGGICAFGQLLFWAYMQAGLTETHARISVSVTLIGIAAVLTAFKVFDNIAKIAGAGTIVPITGFANSVVSPAMEYKSEGFIMGMGAKMFVIAGPVLVYGITSSMVYGLVLYLIRIFT